MIGTRSVELVEEKFRFSNLPEIDAQREAFENRGFDFSPEGRTACLAERKAIQSRVALEFGGHRIDFPVEID